MKRARDTFTEVVISVVILILFTALIIYSYLWKPR